MTGKRGQADSITYNGKTIKQGDEIELNNVNISQDDSMPDIVQSTRFGSFALILS